LRPSQFRRLRSAILGVGCALASTAACAQDISVTFGQGGGLTERVLQLIALLTVLSLAPSILVMVTSFTRIVVVLSLLRTALGTATAPPNAVLISLAMFLTAFVMWPTFTTAYDVGVRPLMANEITPEQAFERASDPFRAFMQKNVRDKDLKLFMDLSRTPTAGAARGHVAARARALLHDLRAQARLRDRLPAVPAVPDHRPRGRLGADVDGHDDAAAVVVSLPFKLIFFVLVDGWHLVAGSLVQSYGP
jgi:flagellar biosynthetic protein FliP